MTKQEELMGRVANTFPDWDMEKEYDASLRAQEYSFVNDVVDGYKPFVIIGDKVDVDYLEGEELFIRGMLDLYFKDGCRQPLNLLYGFKKVNGGERVLLCGVHPDFS